MDTEQPSSGAFHRSKDADRTPIADTVRLLRFLPRTIGLGRLVRIPAVRTGLRFVAVRVPPVRIDADRGDANEATENDDIFFK